MIGLAAEERLGDKQREIGVLHARCLEHVIELALHLFPNGVAIGLDDHAATHCGLFGEIGLHNQFVIPLRVVIGSLS